MRLLADRAVIEFDHHSQHYRDHWAEMARELHATGRPIAWSESHGGFWLVGSWQACRDIGSDWATFTSVNDLTGDENGGRGQLIPQNRSRFFLGESDPPLHTGRRRLEAPFFTPKAVRQWGDIAQRYLTEAIDEVIEAGRAELIEDVIVPAAARTTMHMVGCDPDDWRDAALSGHAAIYTRQDDPAYPLAEQQRLRRGFRQLLLERRANPSGDLASSLATGLVEGVPLSDDEAESMINILVVGGFDTVTALVAHALIWLQGHPEEAERLRTDGEYRANAIEEFLRVFPPANLSARTATRDTEVLGQSIAAGERVAMWMPAANRDPTVFDQPDEVRLDRVNARHHLSFSSGVHRCLGAGLAKVEVSAMLEALLTRLSGLTIDVDTVVPYPSYAMVSGFVSVPATFAPGSRSVSAG